VLVALPDTNGWVTLRVRFRTAAPVSASVRVHGFSGGAQGPRVDGLPYAWPSGGAPTALAFQDGRLVLVDYRTNVALRLTADSNLGSPCLNGPVPSATEPGLVVVAPQLSASTCGSLIAVPISPSAASADTGPTPFYYWPAIHLGRGRWLVSEKRDLVLYAKAPSGDFSPTFIPCSQPTSYAVSPRRDRVVPTQCWLSLQEVPVIDPLAGGVAYSIAGLTFDGGAAFSDGGDTLYVVGTDTLSRTLVFALDATSGRKLGAATLAVGGASGMAADPGRPWIYIMGVADGQPYVDVIERASLAHLARLRVPLWAVESAGRFFSSYLPWVLVMSPVQRQLLLTVNNWSTLYQNPAEPTYVLRFDLLP